MRSHYCILLLFLAGLSGCSSLDPQKADLARKHVFMVTNEGKYRDPAQDWKWSSDREAPNVLAALNTISNSIQRWSQSERTRALTQSNLPPRVVVFVHGGLNTHRVTRDRLVGTNAVYSVEADGRAITNYASSLVCGLLASNCYPVFIVWNSGLMSSYWEHLTVIRQGERHPVIGVLTSPALLASDLARGLVRLPSTLSGRIYSDAATFELTEGHRVKRWEGFESLIAANCASTLPAADLEEIRVGASAAKPLYRPPSPEKSTRGMGERLIRMTEYFITTPTKIAFLPIIDGIGTEAWNAMLRRTRTMFEPPDSYDIARKLQSNQWNTEVTNAANFYQVGNWLRRFETNDTAAMYFLSRDLVEWSTNSFAGLGFEFYGHSMGAIVLNQLFHNQQDIAASRIGYLGAACTIQEFETSLFPYLRNHPDTEFFSLSLHRMRERSEYPFSDIAGQIPIVRDAIPRGSLLNWIDDIFAKPNTITDRTLGAWENITRALPDIPQDLRGQIHFRGCDVEPMPLFGGAVRKEPQIHGDFGKTVFWSDDVLWPQTKTLTSLLLN